jgi:lipopolysaccharide biosynthesis glycosyltransferase
MFTLESFDKVHYAFSDEPIDVVIPCSPKDIDTLKLCIEGIRKNGKDIRRIIVVSKEPLTDTAEWFSEANYPFSKFDLALEIFDHDEEAVKNYLSDPRSRMGWIYQQFLKFYAPYVIPDISSNVLILDADVIFLNPTSFRNNQGGPYLTTAREYHIPYFEHMKRLLPGLYKCTASFSGIAHHMLFQKQVLDDLFNLVETTHQVPFWKAVCQSIDTDYIYESSFSEYEIYFNFALLRTDQATIRHVNWVTLTTTSPIKLLKLKQTGVVYAACHTYCRE